MLTRHARERTRATAQGLGKPGSPGAKGPAFEHGDYYEGPDDEVFDQVQTGSVNGYPYVSAPPGIFDVLSNNHNLVATNSDDNEFVLRDLQRLVEK